MKRTLYKILLTAAFVLAPAALPRALAEDLGQAPVAKQAPLFYRNAVSQYFQAPEEQVALAARGKIKEEELPVLFLIVQKSQASQAKVARLREKGASWLTTARKFGVTPEDFYVPLKKAQGPFRKPLGYYKSRKRSLWKRIVLRDAEIVNLVNLKFLSGFYHQPPELIAGWRDKGKNFEQINAELQARQENR